MNEKNIRIARNLTYAGTLPFLLLSLAINIHISGYDYSLALRAYAAVIISFLCGIHWAVFLFFSKDFSKNLFVQSNGIALLGWASVLGPINHLALAIEIFCFLYLLVLDRGLYQANLIPTWFWRLRRNATAFVTLLLCLAFWHS